MLIDKTNNKIILNTLSEFELFHPYWKEYDEYYIHKFIKEGIEISKEQLLNRLIVKKDGQIGLTISNSLFDLIRQYPDIKESYQPDILWYNVHSTFLKCKFIVALNCLTINKTIAELEELWQFVK